MRQRKMKQRESKQSKSLAKILTLGIAAATVVSSMSVPGGLLAPETVYASDNTGTAESGDQGTAPQEETIQFDVSIRPNDSATVYVMQVTSLADTDMMSYQYSINGTDYYSLQKLQTQETFGASQKVDLHVRAVGSDDTILAAGNREITTPSASDVPTISGTDKFSDRTEVTITATPGAIIYYTTDGTVPTNGSQQYNTPITLTETTTIQAIAIEDGHIMSDVVGMAFTKESSGGSSSGRGDNDKNGCLWLLLGIALLPILLTYWLWTTDMFKLSKKARAGIIAVMWAVLIILGIVGGNNKESTQQPPMPTATIAAETPQPTAAPTSTPQPTATPTPEPTATPEPAEAKPTMVYIANSGTKYHRLPSCSGMENPTEVTLEQAESWGYTPCKRCY